MLKIFGKNYPVRKLLLFIVEGGFLFLSFAAVDVFKNQGDMSILNNFGLWGRLLLIVFVCQLCLYYNNLYSFVGRINFLEMSTRLFQAIGVACIILGFVFLLFPGLLPEKQIFIASLLAFIILSSAWRYGYCYILKHRYFASPVFLLGMGEFFEDIFKEIDKNIDCGYKVAAAAAKGELKDKLPSETRFYDTFDNLYKKVKESGSRAIIVAMDERRGNLPVDELLDCRLKGVPVLEGESFFEEINGRILIDKINPSWLIFKEGFNIKPLAALFKRVFGVVLALIGLAASAPISLLTIILIKLDSPGPVFFIQQRTGKDGKLFNIIKFRSMRTDAEKDGAKWATENDSRVTRVGKVIRKTRIDEIPQMWNVLRGDMNFVGPRPERPVFVDELSRKIRYYNQRHIVRPGITGWAQINYPYGASIEDAKRKLEYDLYYIKHMSIFLDLYIILKTVKTIIFKLGAR